jgi:hypothetical protein
VVFLNILPIIFFWYAIWVLSDAKPSTSAWLAAVEVVVGGVLPAGAVFSFYRFWIAIVEWWPDSYYHALTSLGAVSDDGLKERYWHFEPTYRKCHCEHAAKTVGDNKTPVDVADNLPVVDLGPEPGRNCCWAIVYLVIGMGAPWLTRGLCWFFADCPQHAG